MPMVEKALSSYTFFSLGLGVRFVLSELDVVCFWQSP